MSLPVFSIVIPVYNAESRICRSVQSVVEQSFSGWELILVDDGSSDNSLDICNQLSMTDERIRVYSQDNKGVSSARNYGLRLSRGQYITFLDADDWLVCDALQKYNDVINSNNPDIIKFGYIRNYANNKQEVVVCDKLYFETAKVDMLNRVNDTKYWGYVWNTVYSKYVVNDIFFDEDISWLEDHIFTLRTILKAKSMILLPESLYHYTINDDASLSNNKSPKDIYMASSRSYFLNLEILEQDTKGITSSKSQYHYFNNLAVKVLYTGEYTYRYRKSLYNIFYIEDKKNAMLYERVFAIRSLPFIVVDLLASFIFVLRLIFKRQK